jgi:hypothetical protein
MSEGYDEYYSKHYGESWLPEHTGSADCPCYGCYLAEADIEAEEAPGSWDDP